MGWGGETVKSCARGEACKWQGRAEIRQNSKQNRMGGGGGEEGGQIAQHRAEAKHGGSDVISEQCREETRGEG